jgi:hypothetical protein
MAVDVTSDEDLKKAKTILEKTNEELINKLNKLNRSKLTFRADDYSEAFKEFNEAFLKASASRRIEKSTWALLAQLKNFSSNDSGSTNPYKDYTEKLKEFSLKKSSKKETKDKSSLKLLLEDLLDESSNRINHLEKLKEQKIALLKSI